MAGNSSHPIEEERNPNVRHEPDDVNAHALTRFGLIMSALVVVFLFALWGMFEYLRRREAEVGAPVSRAAIVNTQKLPPEPRLQPYPQRDMRDMRADEERLLHQYGWVDPDKGVVKIPIDRAMDLITQRGFPALQRQGKSNETKQK